MEYAIKYNDYYESMPFTANVIQTKGRGNITINAKVGDGEYVKYQTYNGNGDVVRRIDLPKGTMIKLTSVHNFNYTAPSVKPRYMNKTRIGEFLYDITYGNIDYAYANEYFKTHGLDSGGCSAIRNGNTFGRNFDWSYNNDVTFVVRTPKSFEHHEVIGVAGIVKGIDKQHVDDDEIYHDGYDMFKILPFQLLDGINEKRLFCTQNLVPLDDEDNPTRTITAMKDEKDSVFASMLPRFILDKFDSAKKAVYHLINHTTIRFNDAMLSSGYQTHLMIGDLNDTYVVEFINGEIKVTEGSYMTNFQIDGVAFDSGGKVQYPPTEYGIRKYGNGLERWNIIRENYPECKTVDGMRSILNLLRYSNTYGQPFWFSELVRHHDNIGRIITVDTDPELCTFAENKMRLAFQNRTRNHPQVDITTHSSVYDVRNMTLYLVSQESDTEYVFEMH